MVFEKRFNVKSIFTGNEWLTNQAVILQHNVLVGFCPKDSAYPVIDLLIPSFIDLQVYGAADHLFSAFPSRQTLDLMYHTFKREGTHFFLPTIATNDITVVAEGIKAVKEYWENNGKGCLGLHLEGPWINPAKRGAHDERFIKVPTLNEVQELLSLGRGVIKMITLAPEICDKAVLNYLLDANVIISAGHSMATYEQGLDAFANGVSLVTHLFNAMSPLQHRAPGLVGASLLDGSAMASIIPDGLHVDWPVVKLAFQTMGSRLFVITDAVAACDSGPYQHTLNNDHYVSNGILSGSALTMLKAFNNLVFKADISVRDAVSLCVSNPARAFNCSNQLASLAAETSMPYIPLALGEGGFEIIN